jgi:hypothetical protein
MISLNRTDRVRLIGVDENVIEAVRQTIISNWKGGEPETRDYFGAFEFKLRGTPFCCSGYDAVAARRLIAKIMVIWFYTKYYKCVHMLKWPQPC